MKYERGRMASTKPWQTTTLRLRNACISHPGGSRDPVTSAVDWTPARPGMTAWRFCRASLMRTEGLRCRQWVIFLLGIAAHRRLVFVPGLGQLAPGIYQMQNARAVTAVAAPGWSCAAVL